MFQQNHNKKLRLPEFSIAMFRIKVFWPSWILQKAIALVRTQHNNRWHITIKQLNFVLTWIFYNKIKFLLIFCFFPVCFSIFWEKFRLCAVCLQNLSLQYTAKNHELLKVVEGCWKQNWISQQHCSAVTSDCGLDSGSTTCSILLTTLNNVGSTTLFNPVFNNLQQFVIFCRVLFKTPCQR